jgi:hypothetical protein
VLHPDHRCTLASRFLDSDADVLDDTLGIPRISQYPDLRIHNQKNRLVALSNSCHVCHLQWNLCFLLCGCQEIARILSRPNGAVRPPAGFEETTLDAK